MLVDWNSVNRGYDQDQARGFFHNILTNMDNEFVVKFVDDFLSNISSQNFPVSKSLFLLKSLLSSTPKYAFFSLSPPHHFQNWFLALIMDVDNVTSSLRSVGLAVVGLMTKNMKKDVLNLDEIGKVFSCSILDAVSSLTSPYESEQFQFGRLLMHQCVDNFSSVADDSAMWIQSIGNCIFDICYLLRILADSPPTFQGSGAFLVDISKLFTRVVSIWFSQCQGSADQAIRSFQNRYPNIQSSDCILLFRNVPDAFFQLINSQRSLIHDAFQTAFYSALEIAYRASPMINERFTNEFTGDVAKSWTERVIKEIDIILDPCPSENDHDFLKLGRVEFLLLLVSSVFSLRKELSKDAVSLVSAALEHSWFAATEQIFELIIHVMGHLKSQGRTIPPEMQKSFRSFASNVRKASIALSEIVLAACPLFLRFSQPNQQRLSGEQFVLSFCLQTLSTPSLFPQIYRSFKSCNDMYLEDFPIQPKEAGRDSLIATIIRHLGTGLRQISRYSMPAGIDLVAVIDELATENCTELISFEDIDIPLLILVAYSQPPKTGVANSSSDLSEWKTHCLTCLQSIMDLYALSPSTHSSYAFLKSFAERVPSDIILLHNCLGNFKATDDAPSAKERARKASLSVVTSSFKITNPDEFLPILQNLVELQSKYFDVIDRSSSEVCEVVKSELLNLFLFLMDISLRPLLFEDDCSLLCSELDLMSKFVSLTLKDSYFLQRNDPNTSDVDVRSLFLSKLREIEKKGIDEQSITDGAQLKMIQDNCQFHIQKLLEENSAL